MKFERPLIRLASAVLLAGQPGTLCAWQPGVLPVAPARMQSTNFSVDNQDRNDVIAFWNAVYMASEGYESRVKWTGNYTGAPGTTSAVFVKDVERRLNYFRAMCGAPSDARVNSGSTVVIDASDPFKPKSSVTKAAATQQSALMMIRNYNWRTGTDLAITHYPANNLISWTAAAWNANAHGNIAFGLYGPGAITEYLVEAQASGSATSSWNTDVGHRRWCLFPSATDYATGDQPGTSAKCPPTNAFYVIQKPKELRSVPAKFVSYPPAGYFPAQLNSPFWSLSYPRADFSSATVSVTTHDNKPVTIGNIKRKTGFGDPAIVWQVSSATAVRSVFNDVTYHVKVSGIAGEGVPDSCEYSVTLINPDRLLSDQAIVGPDAPAPNQTTPYTINPPSGAEALQVAAYKRTAASWIETAENPTKSVVIDDTTGSYGLFTTMKNLPGFGFVSGMKSFRLTFPTSYDLIGRGVPEQSFEIDRNILPNSKANVSFRFRRGYMTTSSKLAVEISNDDGLTWKQAGKLISGVSNTTFDLNISTATVPLSASATPIRIRFRYYTIGGSIYTHEAAPKSPTGIFIDDIKLSRCDCLERKKVNSLPANANEFDFNATTAGAAPVAGEKWMLRTQSRLGGKWFNGPMKPLTVSAP